VRIHAVDYTAMLNYVKQCLVWFSYVAAG